MSKKLEPHIISAGNLWTSWHFQSRLVVTSVTSASVLCDSSFDGDSQRKETMWNPSLSAGTHFCFYAQSSQCLTFEWRKETLAMQIIQVTNVYTAAKENVVFFLFCFWGDGHLYFLQQAVLPMKAIQFSPMLSDFLFRSLCCWKYRVINLQPSLFRAEICWHLWRHW